MDQRLNQANQTEVRVDGNIHVSLWGFRQCPWASPESVAQVLEMLPKHLLSGLAHIRYLSRALVPSTTTWVSAPGNVSLSGVYSQEDRTILIQAVHSRTKLFHVLFHELGHHIYFALLDSVEKKHWVVDIWGSEDPVSEYGKRNAAEDFAELFALYLQGTSLLIDRPIKTRFLRETLLRSKVVPLEAIRAVVNDEGNMEG